MRTMIVETEDGLCPVHVHAPEGAGPWPLVLVYLDAPGVRPALQEIAGRIAAGGYVVALPDLFYRGGAYDPIEPRVVFADPELRAEHRRRRMEGFSTEAVLCDTRALLACLRLLPEVSPGPIAVVGYCLGGRLALVAASVFASKVNVAAAFHPGHVATEDALSPHKLAKGINARILVAVATLDPSLPTEMKDRLATALREAGVRHDVRTWPARHGWVPRDTASHDPEQAERHWEELMPLLAGGLRS